MREFYAYKLAISAGFNPVLESSKLTQQYVVDQWVKIEHQRLQYLRENQRQLRVDWYRGLHDHIQWRQNQQNQQNRGDAAAGVPVSRVFRQYLNAFISNLWENGILGRGTARIHVIEFQNGVILARTSY